MKMDKCKEAARLYGAGRIEDAHRRAGKLRVAAYCRVSTSADNQDSSYAHQREYYERHIAQHPDYVLAGIYGDQGKSGRQMRTRPELRRMLMDCEQGKIDLILTKSISRFARNMRECVETVRYLRDLGVTIYFEREGLRSTDGCCELFLAILASIAQEESNSISRNLLWTHARRNSAGRPICPRAAYGYALRNGSWCIDEDAARRVRLAFEMAERGCSLTDIRAGMNALEVAEGTGRVWGYAQPGKMLRQVCYMGDILTNKQFFDSEGRKVRNRGERDQYYIEDHHPAIVTREQFERVGRLLDAGALNARTARRAQTQHSGDAQAGEGKDGS